MIAIQAVFKSARSLVDGGWVISFDTHEGMVDQVTQVAKRKEESLYLVVMTESEFEASRSHAD